MNTEQFQIAFAGAARLVRKLPVGTAYRFSYETADVIDGAVAELEIVARTDREYESLKVLFGLTGTKEERIGSVEVTLWPPATE